MTTLHIKNGHLIDPANGIDGLQDLFIADGKVAAVGSAPAGFVADTTFDTERDLTLPACDKRAAGR